MAKRRLVCKHGHLFSSENTYVAPSGRRSCKICRKTWQQNNLDKHRIYNRKSYAANADTRRQSNRERWQKSYKTDPTPHIARVERYRSRAANTTISDFTVGEWLILQDEFDVMCAYCGDSNCPLTQDHILPLSRGGAHTYDNIVPACRSCNSRKHTKTDAEFLTGDAGWVK